MEVRVAFLAALPFHEWCLEDLRAACDEAGHTTEMFVHRPAHGHDWLSTDGGRRLRDEVAAWRPDLIVLADYPYNFTPALPAPVLAVRHSLASRGNTYEPEQFCVDHLVIYGKLDLAIIGERLATLARLDVGTRLRGKLLSGIGAPWLDRIRHGDIATHRLRLREYHMLSGEKHAVLFAPTWNRWTDVGAVAAWAKSRPDLAVFLRPHPATAWRDRERLVNDGFAGATNPMVHPAHDILAADVVITDVSGIGLMTVCAPDAAIPVVQITSITPEMTDAQIDYDGPEFTQRFLVGKDINQPRGDGYGKLNAAIDEALTTDPYRDRRRALRGRLMYGAEDSKWNASEKLAAWIGTIAR